VEGMYEAGDCVTSFMIASMMEFYGLSGICIDVHKDGAVDLYLRRSKVGDLTTIAKLTTIAIDCAAAS
jgi:hypothetical protein